MRRRFAAFVVSVACCLVVGAPGGQSSARATDGGISANDSPRHQEWVRIPTAQGRALRTFVVYPEANKRVHAVVVVHENRGLTAWERSLADQLAAAGYVAIVPDLLSETGPDKGASDAFESAAAAREAIHNLTPEQVAADLDAVVEYAGNLSAADKKVAVAGFCWGGGQAFRFAAHNSDIEAVMVFYGAAPSDEQLKQIRVPVHAFYGENDLRITGDVPKLKVRMKALEKSYQAVTYAGAGHGFMRAGEAHDAKPADRTAHDEAWTRFVELLSKL
jgi:carboxymethylenebutenolidase